MGYGSWAGTTQFQQIAGALASRVGRDFQRAIVPFVRAIWPQAVESPDLATWDQCGIDHMVWSDSLGFPLVVQAKGFEVREEELGSNQIVACERSIQSFLTSDLKTTQYLLIHNRHGADPEFRRRIGLALDALVKAGKADIAELWNLRTLLLRSFDGVRQRVESAAAEGSLARRVQALEVSPTLAAPVERVPYERYTLTADQHALLKSSERKYFNDDPGAALLQRGNARISLVLSEFGQG